MESHQGTEETEQLPTGGTGGRDARHDRENCSFKGQGGFLNWDCRKPGAKDNERVRGKGQGSGLGVLGFGGGVGGFCFVLCFISSNGLRQYREVPFWNKHLKGSSPSRVTSKHESGS